MATYNIHAGHNFKVPGASGCFSETTEARNVKNKVISLLRSQGHTVYDCTDENGATDGANLANIVNKQNQHMVDLDVSIHFNAFNGSAHGVEVLQYDGGTNAVSTRILNKIVALGFTNRGIKDGSWLYVCSNSISPAILIECCFCDSPTDAKIYNADSMAKAIAEGILNKSIGTSSSTSSSNNTTKPTTTTNSNLYRVRKTWEDAKSQIGAYSSLDNAKKACIAGYSVFDSNGKVVYSNQVLYRVRKTWEDTKSQVGAYSNLDNAKKACIAGYSVFDSNGKVVYTAPTTTTQSTTKPSDDTTTETPRTDVPMEDVNNLKDLDHAGFLQYIGNLAKEDYKSSKILPSITIAQAILESGWGSSELACKANNLFGMKKSLSGDNWGSEWDGKIYAVRSKEEINGELIDVCSDFRAFESIEDCIKDHSKYLANAKNGNTLRYNGLVGEVDYKEAANIIKNGGYATDSGYVNKLVNLIEENNLHSYDYASDPSDNKEDTPVVSPTDTENTNGTKPTETDGIKDIKNNVNIIVSILRKIAEILSRIFTK